MSKTFILFCFLLFGSATVRSQNSLPIQYLDKLQHLVKKSAEHTPATQLINFAEKLIGVPYRYASSNPEKGFDCSGFVNYVFENFGFNVPRSSPEFIHAGTPVKLTEAKVGDVLIFTGSNPRVRRIGHVGIVYSIEGDEIKFIHASSGKANAVTITKMDDYYKSRFVKAVSII